ncbi:MULTISPECIES: hypothetical protein [Myroides]|uniref:Uncharacterized protein n=1 Tax=Myroides albus TaxID=2562892 RepID=A0A6I3LKW7_9FLAO|nr:MULTISPECIES: hypothetical protein [Myroides]MTG97900.1 hypothetical protein [Myroides albus]MVX36564.1 hypothetical protein [Myroides sp. LoEW2-1]UVD81088.1 hypothetical protein NWE55_07515 [Myroides albus]
MNILRLIGRVALRTICGSIPFLLAYLVIERSHGLLSKFISAWFMSFLIFISVICYVRFVVRNASSPEADKEEKYVDILGLIAYLVMWCFAYSVFLGPEMR